MYPCSIYKFDLDRTFLVSFFSWSYIDLEKLHFFSFIFIKKVVNRPLNISKLIQCIIITKGCWYSPIFNDIITLFVHSFVYIIILRMLQNSFGKDKNKTIFFGCWINKRLSLINSIAVQRFTSKPTPAFLRKWVNRRPKFLESPVLLAKGRKAIK